MSAVGPDHPTFEYLRTLKRRDLSAIDRQDAFERLLDSDGGWWGPRTLHLYASARALAAARAFAITNGLSPDELDWEEAATDALLALFSQAPEITSDTPRAWLDGVIRNKVRQRVQKIARHGWPTELSEDLAAPEAHEVLTDDEASQLSDKCRAVLDAIESLPRAAERDAAKAVFLDGKSSAEAAQHFKISAAAMRQRIHRARMGLLKIFRKDP